MQIQFWITLLVFSGVLLALAWPLRRCPALAWPLEGWLAGGWLAGRAAGLVAEVAVRTAAQTLTRPTPEVVRMSAIPAATRPGP